MGVGDDVDERDGDDDMDAEDGGDDVVSSTGAEDCTTFSPVDDGRLVMDDDAVLLSESSIARRTSASSFSSFF